MITKTTLPTRANYLEQFLDLSKTISTETITEAFDSNSLREEDLKSDLTLLEVLSEVAKELNDATFDFESLEKFYKEFNLESTPPEWFKSAKAVKDAKKVGEFKKFYKIMFEATRSNSLDLLVVGFAECMKNYFYLSSKDYEIIKNEFYKLFKGKKIGFTSKHVFLKRFLFNKGIASFYKFLTSIFLLNNQSSKIEFKIFYSFSKNKFSFKKDINNFEIGIFKLNRQFGIPSNHVTKISESDSPAEAIKEIVSSMIKSHYQLLSKSIGLMKGLFEEGRAPLELLTDEELKVYLRNKELYSLQLSFVNIDEIQKDRISKIIYSYVFEESEF